MSQKFISHNYIIVMVKRIRINVNKHPEKNYKKGQSSRDKNNTIASSIITNILNTSIDYQSSGYEKKIYI